ncbi:MAG TPA: amino acid adenylation domain-containing protein, partial [Candidatus Kapabacteria bacterium]|nr:amino acid adenylation domain-containing protein [Candidatus Kapabacteria bacterium]
NLHPSVRECAVICDDSAGDKRLLAYVVPRGKTPSFNELRDFAAKRLPAYMLPRRVIMLDEIPLTVNGKVNRKALPLPDSRRHLSATSFCAPTSQAEKALAQIWESVLTVSQVGINDNFFELGGDSIRSIQVLARAEAQGLKISLQTIFSHPTIAGILANLNSESEDQVERYKPFALVSPEDREKLPASAEDAYPIGKLQHGMIYHSDYDKESAIFHDVFSFRLQLPYEAEKLREAACKLTGRHTIFRTSFHLDEYSEPLQVVHEKITVPFTEEDLRTYGAGEQKQKLVAWVEDEKRKRFDWKTAPMLRLHVQRYSDQAFQIIVSFHHTIMDGWSLAYMLTELFQDYSNILKGGESKVTPPQVNYRDFVSLEQRTINAEASRTFWKNLIQDPVIHKLPRWPHKPETVAKEQTRGPEIYFPNSLLRALQTLARSCGVPIRTVLLAAHCRVMGLLTGQSDVLTGLVANGRPQCTDGDRMIGLFLNTLPFRLRFEGDTWRTLIHKVFSAEQNLIPHRRMPLSEIQQMASGQNLFETTFDFVQFHVYRDLPGYSDHSFLEDYYFEANNFNFFVTFMLDASGGELQMHFDYNPNEFPKEQIAVICEYFNETLRAMVAMPDAACTLTPLLPEVERTQLLTGWNNRSCPIPAELPIQMFERCVATNPSATALVFNDQKYSYGEIDGRANWLASKLKENGAKAGDLIGIFLERTPEMIVSLLAVAKLGGAYVPLDPSYPNERLSFMVEDAGLETTLTSRALAGRALDLGCKSICMVDDAGIGANSVDEQLSQDSLAYVIYTSGSTGKPKGVQISQRALMNLLCSMKKEPGLKESDRLLAVTTLSFDIAGLEIWLPLISGATIILANSEEAKDPRSIVELLSKHDATIMQATPSLWSALIQESWTGKADLVALCGGESLQPTLARELAGRTSALWNMYGPTETTIWSTTARIKAEDEMTTVGMPIDNTLIYILDEDVNPVPIGSVGEIYIGGEGLAKGYLNRDNLTAERFISNPFRPNGRIYRTGDLGRYLPDGRIVCLGRADNQVKVRGFRIELGEVEAALEKHSGVEKAVVTASQDSTGVSILNVYWTGLANTKELRSHLEGLVPNYMVPSRWMQLKEMPLTPNGKIDRKNLPTAEPEDSGTETTTMAPSTDTERVLSDIWTRVLGSKNVSITDDFFSLGGHSLAAMRIVANIRTACNVDLPLMKFFEKPTIQALAHEVDQLTVK